MGWTNDLTETIVVTGPSGTLVVINAVPIPAALTAYYTAGSPATFVPPDHIVSVNQNFDGHGNYSYQAVVVDSSASPVTAVAFGTNIGGTVKEVSRVTLNPSGGGSSNTFYEHSKITLHTGSVADLTFALLATSQGSDINADRMTLRADGGITWGPGGTNKVQDTQLYRVAAAVLAVDGLKSNVAGAAEAWHAVTFQNSWVNRGGGTTAVQYRLAPSPFGTVQLIGAANAGTKADGTAVFTLPAGYRPTSSVDVPIAVDAMAGAAAQSPHLSISSAGVATCWGCAGATFFSVSALFPMDA